MGIYDRDYVRDDDDGGFPGGSWMMVSRIVAVNVAVYLVQILFFQGAQQWQFIEMFGLKSDLFSHPWQFYQLLTHGFLHDPNGVWHIIGNMLVLWFLGRDVEGIYGGRVFLQFYLSTIVLAGLGWVLLEQVLGRDGVALGASGGVSGVVVVFAMHYPRRLVYLYFVIPVPVWLAATIFLGIDALSSIFPSKDDKVAHSAHLAGAALGYLFYRTRWQLGALLPTRWIGSFRRRPNVRIHREEEEPQDDDAALKVEVDRILEKISREGEGSLTSHERRTLEDASRRYQKRGRH